MPDHHDDLRQEIIGVLLSMGPVFDSEAEIAADRILSIPIVADALTIARAVNTVLGPVLHSIATALARRPRLEARPARRGRPNLLPHRPGRGGRSGEEGGGVTRRTAALIVKAATIVGMRRWAYRNVYLRSSGWQEFARTVRRFQHGRCAACHRRARLQVHHLHYATLGRERASAASYFGDVVALCDACHHRQHGGH